MENIINFFSQGNTTATLAVLSLTIGIGMIIGKIRIKSFSVGVIAILFVGIALGTLSNKSGITFNSNMMSVLKDFGLILFVYTVGLQVGPSFFVGLRKGGLKLNLQAIAIVVLGAIITVLISIVGEENLDMMVGIYSGSISSTPGLSAAQEAVATWGGGNVEAVAAGYAITYPIGVIIPIVCCIVIRRICKVHLDEETILGIQSNQKENTFNFASKESITIKTVIVLFSGILFGLILGSISVNIPIKGVMVPMKLGNTGGTLVMAILMSHIGNKKGWIDSSVTHSESVALLREIGIVVFLAMVGITASNVFIEIKFKDGAKWILYGLMISVIPTLIVGIFARLRHKTNYFTLMGMIGGATTDTPALAYASKMATNHADGIPAAAYATVYPLTVFLRILTAQLFVIIMI